MINSWLSISNSERSEPFVCSLCIEWEVLGDNQLLWLTNLDSILMSHCGELEFIEGFFVTDEQNSGTNLNQLPSFSISHIWSPIVSKENTTIVITQSCNEIIFF